MPATILTADPYDAVRALIAPDVTDVHVSDAYLSQQPFAPEGRARGTETAARRKGGCGWASPVKTAKMRG